MSLVRVCSLAEIAPGQAKRFDVLGERVAVVHAGDRFFAVGDRCSHANYSLSDGEVFEDDLEIECPKHGSTFSLLTGEAQCLPATKPVPTYDVKVEGDDVLVEVGT